MPRIQVKTNVKTSRRAMGETKEALGQAIGCFPGKNEDWLMVSIEDGCQTFLGGKGSRPIAMMEVRVLGNAVDQEGAKRMTGEMTRILDGALGVSLDSIYIKCEVSPDQGWDGTNF